VKLLGKEQYNILVACETKASALHWEIFTTPGDGILHAYVPGRTPDHVHTTLPVVDGQWHWVAMVMEETRIRLFVDGVEKANAAVAITNRTRVPGPLAIGGLVEGGFGCNGLIDEVRLSSRVRPIEAAPTAELTADESTIGLWHFATGAVCKDSSTHGHDGALRPPNAAYTASGAEIPGGMPAALQPLPPGRGRRAVADDVGGLAGRMKIKTVSPDQIQDGVLREWAYDLQWIGKKNIRKHRTGGPSAES